MSPYKSTTQFILKERVERKKRRGKRDERKREEKTAKSGITLRTESMPRAQTRTQCVTHALHSAQ